MQPTRSQQVPYEAQLGFAQARDAADPLARWRRYFLIPENADGSQTHYFCGNSLGLQPLHTRSYVHAMLDDWARLGVRGHVEAANPWVSYHEWFSGPAARLMGANPEEVVLMNQLTVNLHLLMVSFYRPNRQRYKILIEAPAFPSDRYAVISQLEYHGIDPQDGLIELSPQADRTWITTEEIMEVLEREQDGLALVLLPGVNYYSGQVFDMQAIAAQCQHIGCTVGFDLAHAAGNVPMQLHDWGVDFAVWCSYKYLNGGPGCTAGAFVHARHARNFDLPRFAGWWGHNKVSRFEMGPEFDPLPGAEGWQLSNPSILPLAALRASFELFDQVGIEALRTKSLDLTGYLAFLLDHLPGVEYITPRNPDQRGCQLSIRIPNSGKQAWQALNDAGVICDWREPDIIRVAPTPFYNTYTEVYQFYEILKQVPGIG